MSAERAGGPLRWLQCASCDTRLDELDRRTICPGCGGLLDVRFHVPPGRAADLRQAFDRRTAIAGAPRDVSGVWRYAEFLMDIRPEQVVSFPEGNTPLLSSGRLSAWSGCERLELKHEGMNPTGSFKDRGMTVGLTQARRVGARAVMCASTGNTSASLAAYAARAEVPAFVLVPAGQVAAAKLSQTQAYGATVIRVRGDFDACLALVRDAAERLGVYLLNSVNPWRVEGQKTIVFELLHQRRWQAPDWIALPGGNLGNTAAFGKALEEMSAAGIIDRMPRLLVVQAEGAAPFARSFATGFQERSALKADTVASAIRIGAPASHERAVRAIRLTDGSVIAVSDDTIVSAQREVGAAGIGCEPASAASVAGVRAAVEGGLIRPAESVVAVLTGHVLKDPAPRGTEVPDTPALEIDPSLAALEAAMSFAR